MTLFQLLIIVRARSRIIVSTIIIALAAAVLLSLLLPKTYRASATLLLSFKGADPVSGQILPAQLAGGYMATQLDILTSRRVALTAVDNLGLADDPLFKRRFAETAGGKGEIREWLADSLLEMTRAAPASESSLVVLTVRADDPEFAAKAANGMVEAYRQLNLRLRAEPLQQAAGYLAGRVKTLRAALEAAHDKRSRYQQEHGLVSVEDRFDVETMRLNELSSQLVQAQGQAIEASSRASQAMGGGGRDSPDVISNALVQSLKSALAQAEGRFALLSQNLAPNHPQYRAAKAEVDKLRSELNASIGATNSSVANNGGILRRRAAELRAALAEQRSKVLQLNRARGELALLGREVENIQRTYDAAALRLTQTALEGRSNQSDVAVLSAAVAPTLAASPDLAFNAGLALLLGGMLGVALALLTELANRPVRSGADLIDALPAPLLGAIAWRKPAPQRSAIAALFLSR